MMLETELQRSARCGFLDSAVAISEKFEKKGGV
jgi:hypothetical protein